MYKYILFDFDGTLIDSNEIIVQSLNATALKYTGSKLTNEKLKSILGKPLEVQMKEIEPNQWEALDGYFRTYYRTHRDDLTKIFDGIYEMLKSLKEQNCVLGIVSNKGTSGINHGIEMFKLESFFDVVIASDDVVNKKPHIECIEKALKELGGNISNSIIVGDSIHDIECGKNAGIKTILVDWTIADKKKIMELKPDYIVKIPKDIVDIVKKENQ